jgi:hypothetical protein
MTDCPREPERIFTHPKMCEKYIDQSRKGKEHFDFPPFFFRLRSLILWANGSAGRLGRPGNPDNDGKFAASPSLTIVCHAAKKWPDGVFSLNCSGRRQILLD